MTDGHDFEATFREVYPRLVSLGVLKTGQFEIARDLAQETMLRAHDRWDELAGYDAPAMWCRVVMTNLLVDHSRSVASERAAVDRLGRQTADGERRPLDSGSTSSLERWNDLVRALPDRQRLTVTLYYADDLSVSQIANLLNTSRASVKAMLFKARRTLRSRLLASERQETPMDDRIRALAHRARGEVEYGLDLDRELADTLTRDPAGTASVPELSRRRRHAAAWAAAAAVAVAVGVAGLWLTDGDGESSVRTAVPPVTEPVAAATIEPEAAGTVPPATTIFSSTTTVAPSTTIGESVAPLLPMPGTIRLGPSDLITRTTDGDIWWYPDQPGEPVLLIDRPDPRITPAEGEGPNIVDEVAGTFDGSLIYTDCCEPVSGNVFAIGEPGAEVDRSLPTGLSDRFQLWGVGTNPHLEPGGTRVLMHNWDFVNVVDLVTGDQQFVSTTGSFGDPELNTPGSPFTVDDATWTPSGAIVLLGRSDTNGVILTERDADDVTVEIRRAGLDLGVDPQTPVPIQIVGTNDESIFIAAYRPDGLQLVAVDLTDWTVTDAVLPFEVPATSDFVRLNAGGMTAAWITDGKAHLQRSGEAPIEWRTEIAEIWFPSIETSGQPSDPP